MLLGVVPYWIVRAEVTNMLKYSLVLKYLTSGTKKSNEHWTYFRVQPLADSPSLSTNFPSRGCRFHTLANKWGNANKRAF